MDYRGAHRGRNLPLRLDFWMPALKSLAYRHRDQPSGPRGRCRPIQFLLTRQADAHGQRRVCLLGDLDLVKGRGLIGARGGVAVGQGGRFRRQVRGKADSHVVTTSPIANRSCSNSRAAFQTDSAASAASAAA